jgi:hypothetical protein
VRIVFDTVSPQLPSFDSGSPRLRGWFSERTPPTHGLFLPASEFHFSVTGQVRKLAAFAQPHSSARLEPLPNSFLLDRESGFGRVPHAIIRYCEEHHMRRKNHCCFFLMTHVRSFSSVHCSPDVRSPFGKQNHSQILHRAVRFLEQAPLCLCVRLSSISTSCWNM